MTGRIAKQLSLAAFALGLVAGCNSQSEATAAPPKQATTAAARPAATAPVAIATGPSSWKLPMDPAKVPAADSAAIMKAAGYKKIGKKWASVQEDDTADPACSNPSIAEILDLNKDGKPEAIVGDDSNMCNGQSSDGFEIVAWTGTAWRHIFGGGFTFTGLNYPLFFPRPGSAWPDLESGGFGGCHERTRWSGKDYSVAAGWSIDNKKCTPPPDMM